MKDYKHTLLMPMTDFEMKASLVEKQKTYLQHWESMNLYQEVLKKNKNGKSFVLHDGPPYANGSIHIGHALNKILKDIVIRQKSMLGFYTPYVPGWDTHGLPIENKMLEDMNKNKQDFSVLELRKKALAYALEQVKIQIDQFKTLGLLMDFKDYYVTCDKEYEATQLELFKEMALKGLIFKDLKPVYWSPSSQSALAEAEIVYEDYVSPSVYVGVKITEANNFVQKDDELVIWTTTPWTLVANAGVAIDEKTIYVRVNANDKHYIIAKDCLERVKTMVNWERCTIASEFVGRNLIGIQYLTPITKEKAPVVSGHHVTVDAGSGLVHVAPLFGEDDFIIGKANKLTSIMHINDDGTMNEYIPEYNNVFYQDANKLIGQRLEAEGVLLSLKFIKHSYPHDWRTKKPIMYRATPQWFVSIAKIKKQIIGALESVTSSQEWILKRMNLMIEGRGDWCISRQRAWGVPIPIFYDEHKKPVMNEELFDHVIELVRKHGSNIWYESNVEDLLPKKYHGLGFSKEKDIMDVWFDSGVSHLAVNIENEKRPFDLYLEGSDQFRGWFNSSLITSVAHDGIAPYKQLISHGFVLDGNGNKMSKSKGNVVDPNEIVNKYGSDILRLWVANTEYFNDISISNEIINQNIEIYRKIRTTLRYMLGNLFDFDYEKDHIEELKGVHLLIKERLNNLINDVIKHYESYNFIHVIKDVNAFLTSTSAFYFELAKDILYTDAQNSQQRRSFQTLIYLITDAITKILAPVLPITMEEGYKSFNKKHKVKSIHLENFVVSQPSSKDLETQWASFFVLKDQVYRLIEKMKMDKVVGKSNEVKVYLNTQDPFVKSLDLRQLLIVGEVQFTNKETYVEKFDSVKCNRCWNHFTLSQMQDDICKRCVGIVND